MGLFSEVTRPPDKQTPVGNHQGQVRLTLPIYIQ